MFILIREWKKECSWGAASSLAPNPTNFRRSTHQSACRMNPFWFYQGSAWYLKIEISEMDLLEVGILCINDVPGKRWGKGKDEDATITLGLIFLFLAERSLFGRGGKAFTLFISPNEIKGEQGLQSKKNNKKSRMISFPSTLIPVALVTLKQKYTTCVYLGHF